MQDKLALFLTKELRYFLRPFIFSVIIREQIKVILGSSLKKLEKAFAKSFISFTLITFLNNSESEYIDLI
jgi:hypothetical protein